MGELRGEDTAPTFSPGGFEGGVVGEHRDGTLLPQLLHVGSGIEFLAQVRWQPTHRENWDYGGAAEVVRSCAMRAYWSVVFAITASVLLLTSGAARGQSELLIWDGAPGTVSKPLPDIAGMVYEWSVGY